MALRVGLFCIVSALFALPTLAQDAGSPDGGDLVDAGELEPDAGEAPADSGVLDDDAGPVDCTPRCDGEVLRFCDDEEPVALDCSETGATCGVLTEAWGADCLLPADAACDPNYAGGLSRCEGASDASPTACCVEGVCGAPPAGTSTCRAFQPGTPERPGAGSATDGQDDASSCLGCEGIPLLSLAPLLFGLRLRRRRREG